MRKLRTLAVIVSMLMAITKLCAQLKAGVRFQQGSSWEELKEKARAEHKYVFMDCYATWCGPCKMMDRDVYPNDTVGDFFNQHFISVKVQTDTNKNDDANIQSWYTDAKKINDAYSIKELPTFLFFSPDGELVHRGVGFLPTNQFIELASHALNPQSAFYEQVGNYRRGIKDYPAMAELSANANKFHLPALSDSIADDYIHGYLFKLQNEELLNPKMIEFIATHDSGLGSDQRSYELFSRHSAKVDSLLHDKTYSKRSINYIIYKEQIRPTLKAAKETGIEPDWKKLTKVIGKKFGKEFTPENILSAKVTWFHQTKNWNKYLEYLVESINVTEFKGGFMDAARFNSAAWDVFQYSSKRKELEAALLWSDKVIAAAPQAQTMDTKANLLYKLGRKEEAIALEIKAAETDPGATDIKDNLEKMKKGLRTWIEPAADSLPK